MAVSPPLARHPFRPQGCALALEPRILFDGAAAVAAADAHPAADHHDTTPPAAPQPDAPTVAPPPRTLVVFDSRVPGHDALAAGVSPGAEVLVLQPGDDGLAAISARLAEMGRVDAVQIFSHGAAGQLQLGDQAITAETADAMQSRFEAWRDHLAPGADLQLYGCRIGAGPAGQALVDDLARWTGADVGASDDNTGAPSAGGDWNLEVVRGTLEQPLALSLEARTAFTGLLADADPTVSLGSAGQDVLIGDTFTFNVDFRNTSTQDGYAPFINLFLPTTGRDGDDGLAFVSASTLGQTLVATTVTFDAAGKASHPLARDNTGAPVVLDAATYGLRPGDQMVVLQLPYASISRDQPAISVQVTMSLSPLADTSLSNASPDLTLRVGSGFELGNDALANPTQDPSLIGATTQAFVVHPTAVTLTQVVDAPDGKTATGPNYARTLVVTATPAPGQTLTDVRVTQPLPTNIEVTSIVPASGGRLVSITLSDGRVVTQPSAIDAFIARDGTFLTAFTVAYDTVATATDTVVHFHVPETGADGRPILDPSTGNAVTIQVGPTTATGQWTPLDPRDVTAPATTIDVSGTGQATSFVARSIVVDKAVSIQTDAGRPGLTPGDTLNYTLTLTLSDYFAFGKDFFHNGQFVVNDLLADGQTVLGTPTLTVTVDGETRTLVLSRTLTPQADGSTALAFDIAQSILDATRDTRGWLNGDLAFDSQRDGAVLAVISYVALVGQAYTPPAGNPHNEINEGDSIGNSATVNASVLEDKFNLTGSVQSDTDAVTQTIATRTVDIALSAVNGAAPGSAELRPGDTVTFRLSYDLVTGDYEQFTLTAYLPQPLLDASGVTWSQGGGTGQWAFGAGNTNPGPLAGVTSGPGNSVVFDFGSFATADVNGSRIEVEFTLRVGDQPFADRRALDVLVQSSQTTTLAHLPLVSADTVVINSVAEPSLDIRHGVVSATHGSVTGTTGTWALPGTGGVPFGGALTDLAAVEGSVTGIDGGDVLRLATAIENSGGGGAFDVMASVNLPAGFGFVGGSLSGANLQVWRGDGVQLVAGVDFSVSGNQITFLDPGGVASLQAGRAGTAADASGANLVVITCDVVVDAGIEASRTLQSSAVLSRYASVDGGTDFTPADLDDLADAQVASPELRLVFAGGSLDDGDSSATHTTGSNLVVGERMRYDIVVTLPEGSTRSLRVDDLVPAGLRLDTTFNGGLGYQLITTTGGSAALTADFGGVVTVGGIAATSGTLGTDGAGARFTFTASAATADNVVGNNSFVIRVQLVASNVVANQSGRTRQNDGALVHADPDGDTPNGATPVDRTAGVTGGRPVVTVQEPTLQVSQSLVSPPQLGGYDQGDPVEFSITLTNAAGSTDFSAFDITLIDNLPTQLSNYTLLGVTYLNGATAHGGPDFEIAGGQLRSVAGADIDVAKGGSIVIRVSGVVNATAAGGTTIDNTATVRWTSLDGADAGERTGADGPLAGGSLNDYQRSSTAGIPIARGVLLARVGGLPDTPAANPTTDPLETVAVGEIVHYRAVVLVPEGSNPNYRIRVELGNGLEFLTPDILANTVRIGFGANNGGLTSDANLIVGGTLSFTGNQNSPQAQALPADLSGPAPTGVFDPSRITVVTNADGSQTITFDLGNVTNHDGADADLEGVVLEFNARVRNQASNVAGVELGARVVEQVNGLDRGTSATVVERVVEPHFTGLDKLVTTFEPNTGGTTGNATVQVGFQQDGTLPAYDVRLADGFAGGTGYTLVSLSIDGVVYLPGALPAGVTVAASDAGGVTIDFTRLDVGTRVQAVYRVDVPNGTPVASSDATLTWSSLPETFTRWGGSTVGPDGSAIGERTGSGTGPNTYVLREGAGLGVIAGTLWNDTASATGSTTPDGPGLAGQTVALTWAGADGDLGTAADNRTFTAVTDANGRYHFGVLAAGTFAIDTPTGTISYPQPVGELRVRIDSDGATPLGRIVVSLGEGATGTADAGYVERNDAPVNHLPAPASGLEDVALPIPGLSVTDVDADHDPVAGDRAVQVTLEVGRGTLSLSATPSGVAVGGANTATLVLTGTVADVNLALANLVYLGLPNLNGADTLRMTTRDQGNFGDADGDGIPGEPADDNLTDTDSLQITLAAVNDPPTGVDDTATAVEAGGAANGRPGTDPRGNLLDNDLDVDIATNADRLAVAAIGLRGGVPPVTVPAGGAVVIAGLYGRLEVAADGGYAYIVDNTSAAVQALRTAGQTLVERFDYVLADLAGVTGGATLTVTIQGSNDNPVGQNDTGTAVEAGGVLNGSGGSNAAGNVLANDTDVDSTGNGETAVVSGVRTLREATSGAYAPVAAGSTSASGAASVTGTYGTLFIGADGSYRYEVDNTKTAVQRLVAGDTLREYFSYVVTDAGGLNDVAELAITIQGTNDNPVASDDQATAQAASTNGNAQESNPSGNVILFPSRPGPIDQAGGNGVDLDVDRTDRPSSQLVVTGVRDGAENAGGALATVAAGTTSANGTVVTGQYGTLRIGADGSTTYDVDSTNAAVLALPAGVTLTDTFTYEIADTAGLTDRAQIVITVRGVNDPPVAQTVVAQAIERGGVANGTAGIDPAGDATTRSFDPDGDPLTLTFVRAGARADNGTDVAVVAGQPTVVTGTYGTLTILSDGTFGYTVHNADPRVEALRDGGDLLVERFTFTVDDGQGETDQSEIIVVIHGRNDTPAAADDTATAVEAGGVANAAAGVDPVGNVFDNDTDADGGEVPGDPVDYGETRAVTEVRTGGGAAGTVGTSLRGTYGWLTLEADGHYSYRLDNTMADVQALRGSQDTLADTFTYTLADADGATDTATLTVTVRGANDTPVARDDLGVAVEAGGIGNATPGTNASANVLANDSDVDTHGETLAVSGIARVDGTPGLVGTALRGEHGTLTIRADGSYTYVVDDTDPAVQALRTAANLLLDRFQYTVTDAAGAAARALLSIVIQGRDDNPVAVDDTGTAVEAGGTANGQAGTAPTGNLLANDTDVDAGDSKAVDGVRTGGRAQGTAGFAAVAGATSVAGTFGTLTVNTDGTYTYVLDDSLPAVQALRPGELRQDVFSYRMHDRAGATDIAQLTIVIRGAWDAPVAHTDGAYAVAALDTGSIGIDPSGNVLSNDTDVDAADILAVTGIREGTEAAGGALGPVPAGTTGADGTVVAGQFGDLVIGSDGSYTFHVDSGNPTIQALGPLGFVTQRFTYQVTDRGGLADTAELVILIRGRNGAPVAHADTGTAIEAGGLANADPGAPAGGNVLANDTDIENDPLTVAGVRSGTTAGSLDTPLRGLYGELTLAADGTWTYTVDDTLAAVQALRVSGQTVTDVFTYTVKDLWGATAEGRLDVVIDGRNDTPVAADDTATAVEAGGVANGTAGVDPAGNVLDNDTDVDGTLNGETKQVIDVTGGDGRTALAGQALAGAYGRLVLEADGGYRYELDNTLPAVQALRTAGDSLVEVFTYRMRDAAGAVSEARLTVTVQGADDTPVAVDDTAVASDQTPAPQVTGSVLPNDTDVDAGDVLQVVAVRTGGEAGSGTAGTVGEALTGRYGTLVIHADGTYTYRIDLTNPEVLAAAGLGQVLQDVFTYQVADRAGATDQAELVIHLDIAAPYVPPPAPPAGDAEIYVPAIDPAATSPSTSLPDIEPVVFVGPVVSRQGLEDALSGWRSDGTRVDLVSTHWLSPVSLGAGLGLVPGQHVHTVVERQGVEAELEIDALAGRQGRVSLSADGLLPDPSPFAMDASALVKGPATAPGLRAQLQDAARRQNPLGRPTPRP